MRLGFYPKLAWEGIRKNKRLYLPYILTCIGMIMMNYIIAFLSGTPTLDSMPGAITIGRTLGMAWWIVSLFAAFFLFYSNSFLMRRRKREFGLYNILGMGKWNIRCSRYSSCRFLWRVFICTFFNELDIIKAN